MYHLVLAVFDTLRLNSKLGHCIFKMFNRAMFMVSSLQSVLPVKVKYFDNATVAMKCTLQSNMF